MSTLQKVSWHPVCGSSTRSRLARCVDWKSKGAYWLLILLIRITLLRFSTRGSLDRKEQCQQRSALPASQIRLIFHQYTSNARWGTNWNTRSIFCNGRRRGRGLGNFTIQCWSNIGEQSHAATTWLQQWIWWSITYVLQIGPYLKLRLAKLLWLTGEYLVLRLVDRKFGVSLDPRPYISNEIPELQALMIGSSGVIVKELDGFVRWVIHQIFLSLVPLSLSLSLNPDPGCYFVPRHVGSQEADTSRQIWNTLFL